MNDEREKFLDLFDHICRRPGMYAGYESINAVVTYLSAFEHGLEYAGKASPLTGFWSWLLQKCGIHSEAFGVARSLWHVYGTERAALDALPTLLREYYAVLEAKSVEQVVADYDAWCDEQSKRRWGAIDWKDPKVEVLADVFTATYEGPETRTVSMHQWYREMKERGLIPE